MLFAHGSRTASELIIFLFLLLCLIFSAYGFCTGAYKGIAVGIVISFLALFFLLCHIFFPLLRSCSPPEFRISLSMP